MIDLQFDFHSHLSSPVFQTVLSYSTQTGDRRTRVHTLTLRCSPHLQDTFRHYQAQALLTFYCKKSVDLVLCFSKCPCSAYRQKPGEKRVIFEYILVCVSSVLCSVGAPPTGAQGGIADRCNGSLGSLPQTLLFSFSVDWTGKVLKHTIFSIVKCCFSYYKRNIFIKTSYIYYLLYLQGFYAFYSSV